MMAAELGIPHYAIGPRTHGAGADAAIRDVLMKYKVELVLLVGYQRLVRRPLLEAFAWRILNQHPAPIPAFGGQGMGGVVVQEAVLAAGVTHSGPVIHIVDAEYDHGPIIAYWPVKVRPDDTAAALEARCNEAGRELWVRTLCSVVEWLDYPSDF
jgi:phosphoribosylglycinamide formyltransferase-1